MQTSIKEGKPRTMFHKDKEIIPFIDTYWEGMTTMPRRVTQSWHATVGIDYNIYYQLNNICNDNQAKNIIIVELIVNRECFFPFTFFFFFKQT